MGGDWHDWIGALGSALSALIAAIGLWFIWRQVRMGTVALQDQARAAEDRAQSARSEAKARLLELSEPINRLLFENPSLYDYSYVGNDTSLPEEGSDAWKRAMIVCEMQANYIEFVIREVDILTEAERGAWQNFVHDTFHRPMFQAFWQKHSKWYDPAIETFATSDTPIVLTGAGESPRLAPAPTHR
jgi:ABC-type nickel/cobalt efflux system permease component RcnA